MKFSDLRICPFCGNAEFYTLNYMYGSCNYNQRFDGEEPADNSQMYDGLVVKEGAKAYCNNCFEYLGNRETDTLSKRAEKILAERLEATTFIKVKFNYEDT